MSAVPGEGTLRRYLELWRLSAPRLLTGTPTSNVYRVEHEGNAAVLKIFKPVGAKDEAGGAAALHAFAGQGAVRLLSSDAGAQLLEYAGSEDLSNLVKQGRETARERVERQAVILMQCPQQPALLERAVGRVGVEQLAKDQRLGLRHLPDHGGHRVAVQTTEAADAFVAVHHHVRCACGHNHDRHLLTGVGQRRQQASLARRLPHPQPLIPHIELMNFQLHGPSVRWLLWQLRERGREHQR